MTMREKILTYIERNSRIDIAELALRVNADEQAVLNELEAMEHERVICGYHTLIDWEKTSLDQVSALIEVRVTPQRGQGFDRFAERIYNYPEVKALYLMSGGYDFAVTIEGKSLKEVSMFVSEKLSTIEGVLSTATHFVLKKYKEHGTTLEVKPKSERKMITL